MEIEIPKKEEQHLDDFKEYLEVSGTSEKDNIRLRSSYDRDSRSSTLSLAELNNENNIIVNPLPFLAGTVEKPKNNGKWLTVYLILNTMIGSGILNQPQVFQRAGIIGALVIFVVASYFTYVGLVALIDCGVRHNKLEYSSLAQCAFGRYGEIGVDVAIVINNFGALMSYITVVGGTGTKLVGSWGCNHEPLCEFYALTSFLVIVFVLPLCLLRYYGHLGLVSIMSILAIDSVLFLVMIGGPIEGHGTEGIIRLFSMQGTVFNQYILY